MLAPGRALAAGVEGVRLRWLTLVGFLLSALVPLLLAVVTLGSVWWYVTIYSQQGESSAAPVVAEQAAATPAASGLAEPKAEGGVQEPPSEGGLQGPPGAEGASSPSGGGTLGSPGRGRIALRQSWRTLPSESLPSGVVRAGIACARGVPACLAPFLMERRASEAARSSIPTWSTLGMRERSSGSAAALMTETEL